jgi:hypothetical protein
MTVEWYRAVHEDPAAAAPMLQRQWTEYESRVARIDTMTEKGDR